MQAWQEVRVYFASPPTRSTGRFLVDRPDVIQAVYFHKGQLPTIRLSVHDVWLQLSSQACSGSGVTG
jgi:hypothetical protein